MLKNKLLILLFATILLVIGNSVFAEDLKNPTSEEAVVKETQVNVQQPELKSFIQEDYKDVQKAFDKLIVGYKNKNLGVITDLIADNDHVTFFGSGTRSFLVGKDNIKKAFERDFSTIENINIEVPWISILGKGDVAWLSALVHLSCKMQGKVNAINARETIVFEKINDEWKIVNYHFSLPLIKASLPAKSKNK